MAKLVRDEKFFSVMETLIETSARRLLQERLRNEGKTVTQIGKNILRVEEVSLSAKTLKDYLFQKGRI